MVKWLWMSLLLFLLVIMSLVLNSEGMLVSSNNNELHNSELSNNNIKDTVSLDLNKQGIIQALRSVLISNDLNLENNQLENSNERIANLERQITELSN